MAIRLRIRGPNGQSTVSLDDTATVHTLKQEISRVTSLDLFEVKLGYPPQKLDLSQYEPSLPLSQTNVKLNGEQLLVTRLESAQSIPPSKEQLESKDSRTQQRPKSLVPAPAAPSSAAQKVGPSKSSSAPLSLSRKQNKEMSDPPEIFVPEVGGTLVLRIMPDDNSCLFRAISSAVMSDMDAVTELRQIVAEQIQANPDQFNKAVLDNKEPDKYCRWIKGHDSWGGQIELLILSQYFQIEICSIDVQTLRVDRYNQGAPKRCFVVYSGIHYDTIALTIPGMSMEDDVKQFEAPIKDELLPKAVELCRRLQEKHYYTDTAGFQIVCNDCGVQVVGEKGATKHAAETGHYNFGEAS